MVMKKEVKSIEANNGRRERRCDVCDRLTIVFIPNNLLFSYFFVKISSDLFPNLFLMKCRNFV